MRYSILMNLFGELMVLTCNLVVSIVYNSAKLYTHQNFLKVVVHVIISDQLNQTARLYEIQTVIYDRAILVAVTSECRVKRIICKTWIGTWGNSADPDQTPSDQGLHCLLKLRKLRVKRNGLKSQIRPHFANKTIQIY